MESTLEVTTPSDREIVMTRCFDAPTQLVWDAMTRPELLRKWLFSPPGWELVTCEEDLQPGGQFKWQWQENGNVVMSLTGRYREVVPPGEDGSPGRIVRTESGCLPDGGELLATLEITVRPDAVDQTLLTMTLLYPGQETRDMMLQAGMTQGMEAGYNQLESILTTIHS